MAEEEKTGESPETGQNANPLDVKEAVAADSQMVSSIVSTETAPGETNILGAAPEIDMSLLEDTGPPKSTMLTVLKIAFWALLVLGIAAVVFFKSQLSNGFQAITKNFDIPNLAQDLATTNEEIIKLQTEVNFNRYLQIKGNLDLFAYSGDSYLQYFEVANSQTANGAEQKKAGEEMVRLKGEMKKSFLAARDLIIKNISVPLTDKNYETEAQLNQLFEEKLRLALNQSADAIKENQDPEAKRDYKTYVQTVALVGNVEVKNTLVNTDFDTLSDADLYDLVNKMNKLVVNDLSAIQEIKTKRVKWSDIINEIDRRTVAVDSYYTDDFYDELGGVQYTSYDFDAENRSISIVGETKRFDTTNFTTITNLIDELNRSDFFNKAEMKSFSKAGSLADGYTATVKLDLSLKDNVNTENPDEKQLGQQATTINEQ